MACCQVGRDSLMRQDLAAGEAFGCEAKHNGWGAVQFSLTLSAMGGTGKPSCADRAAEQGW
jgi:hypothetical protein